ncbi:hypothetical protein A3B45_04080 [Candidatus Daviesbacteria bacterium RIFCSPLOWO2_01_FULL_39_12]|uniref:Uncharacterized protein n=1 Tax=Candidatus Daviesbacteria bacterium RIFCSPLOWO2_01_FULL_39_12 TaxID=1797785 RepID=A0A1F5KS59_9BACT|nr:MAG: hypothetical protein A3D79_01085 [Candidatus Daviesbacteria bacterium RIFCSPHIGHO2_02_FULL_39_8]OGE43756.1 MAG: hypothetical protein A3B45_04080 [Candidatus Daviesbacteria bacterium RIFCSPLOWO2_01_FULL_39_12]
MEYLSILPATALGYYTFKYATLPTSKLRQKMPNLQIKRLQFFPVIRFQVFGRVIHLHHWFNFSVLLTYAAFANAGILDFTVTKGLMLGGIIQGLTLPRGHMRVISCKCSYCTSLN